MNRTAPAAWVILFALLACKSTDSTSAPSATATSATSATAATAAPTPNAAPPASAPSEAKAQSGASDYPTDGLKTIADSCSAATAILASVPRKVVEGWKDGQEWTWAVQALLAHPEFTLRDDSTAQTMEVKFLQYDQPNDAVALVAHCHDGVTCNKLAAMYKFTVPSARPQLFCGAKVPGLTGVGATVVKLTPFGGTDSKIPDDKNVLGRCARLHACTRRLDRSSAESLGLSCQRAPGKFKTSCAAKKSCDEVVACAKD